MDGGQGRVWSSIRGLGLPCPNKTIVIRLGISGLIRLRTKSGIKRLTQIWVLPRCGYSRIASSVSSVQARSRFGCKLVWRDPSARERLGWFRSHLAFRGPKAASLPADRGGELGGAAYAEFAFFSGSERCVLSSKHFPQSTECFVANRGFQTMRVYYVTLDSAVGIRALPSRFSCRGDEYQFPVSNWGWCCGRLPSMCITSRSQTFQLAIADRNESPISDLMSGSGHGSRTGFRPWIFRGDWLKSALPIVD